MFFETTERVLIADLKALDRRIRKLVKGRCAAIEAINAELDLDGTGLTGTLDPRWPDNRRRNGCLSLRGVETCYRLYDFGRSPMAVAHLMNLSLVAARRRYRQWQTAGGTGRERVPPNTFTSEDILLGKRSGSHGAAAAGVIFNIPATFGRLVYVLRSIDDSSTF